TKRYTPSNIPNQPRLLESDINPERGGITGVYTVLVDGDDFNEPVADATRSILDGHIVLTRRLAAQNHFPAIDVLDSKSRVRDLITNEGQRRAGRAMLRLEAAYREKEDLIMVGAYQRGSDPYVDAAISYRHQVLEFLQQRPDETTLYGDTYAALTQIAESIEASVQRR
ncbi:MAG: EscN/YscN/HrcN family type III secretion system ATPase, partial [Gemmatimonas sp.]